MGLRLGYLVFGVRRPERWQGFCADMLGLPPHCVNADGSVGWRVDAAEQRLIVQRDEADDVLAIGLECTNEEELGALVRRLSAQGVPVKRAHAAHCAGRRVAALWCTQDPEGVTIELCLGLKEADQPFRSAAFPAGFRTGELGMGHAVLVCENLEAMEAFYGGVLGFGVTERLALQVGPVQVRGSFLHCNARHHSLALLQMPATKRLHHFMLQATSHLDVGVAYERAQRLRVPMALDLGQHPAPDSTFSFYGITPSGFDFEIGAGSGEIEPQGWQPAAVQQMSSWGHRPQWRAKWRVASALLYHVWRRRRGVRT